MSALSKKVTPSSSAASTTARVAFRSARRPKLLQPRPTMEDFRPEAPRGRVVRAVMLAQRSCTARRAARVSWRSLHAVIVAAQDVGEAPGHGGVLALLPHRGHHELVAP